MTHARHLLLLTALAACQGTPATADPREVRAGTRLCARIETACDPGDLAATCKVFHHLFAPDGRLLTKGPGGEFPHHRGLFVGWNQTQVSAARWDFWHCSHGESQRFKGFVDPGTVGLTHDWQVAAIEWRDGKGELVLTEHRALRAKAPDASTTVLDLDITLAAAERPVRLGGDPHHSGVQVRALDAFAAAGAPKVTFVLPRGAMRRGEDVYEGCDWVAAVLPLAGGPVTVLHLDDPRNPRPNRYSLRPYGRFGSTSTVNLQPAAPSHLRYRLAIIQGALDDQRCRSQAQALACTW